MKNKKEKTLEQQVLSAEKLPNLIGCIVFVVYIIFFTKISGAQMLQSVLVIFGEYLLFQFVIGVIVNRWLLIKISNRVETWKNDNLNVVERTNLLTDLMHCPLTIGKAVMIIFGSGTLIWAAYLLFNIENMNVGNFVFILFTCFYSTYIASIAVLVKVENVCSKYATEIVSYGVSEEIVEEKNYFGYSIKRFFLTFILLPTVFSAVSVFMYVYKEKVFSVGQISTNLYLINLALFTTINCLICLGMQLFFGQRFLRSLNGVKDALQKNLTSNSFDSSFVPTDIANEMSYTIYLINQNTLMLTNILNKASEIGTEIESAVNKLVDISSRNSSLSCEQSTGVRHIVNVMEDSDHLSKEINEKISGVNNVATQNLNDVQNGFDSVSESLKKMNEITDANISTINGIKNLNEQIENIGYIVNVISSIADQTKIIAFNAELEASSAGEAGKNFHIVANEIRRLANNTMESTKEIKERITNIQHSSNNLILTSEGGTKKINEGCILSVKLESNFESIRHSSEVTVTASDDIKRIVEKQTVAFEQILITLKQISSGIESSSNSIQSVNELSLNLKKVSESLVALKNSISEVTNIPYNTQPFTKNDEFKVFNNNSDTTNDRYETKTFTDFESAEDNTEVEEIDDVEYLDDVEEIEELDDVEELSESKDDALNEVDDEK